MNNNHRKGSPRENDFLGDDLIDTHRKKNSGEGSVEEEILGAEKGEDIAWESSENLKTNQANDEDSKSESKSK